MRRREARPLPRLLGHKIVDEHAPGKPASRSLASSAAPWSTTPRAVLPPCSVRSTPSATSRSLSARVGVLDCDELGRVRPRQRRVSHQRLVRDRQLGGAGAAAPAGLHGQRPGRQRPALRDLLPVRRAAAGDEPAVGAEQRDVPVALPVEAHGDLPALGASTGRVTTPGAPRRSACWHGAAALPLAVTRVSRTDEAWAAGGAAIAATSAMTRRRRDTAAPVPSAVT